MENEKNPSVPPIPEMRVRTSRK